VANITYSADDSKPHLAHQLRHATGFLALPISAIRQHGQAAQTLAGLLSLLRMDGRTTFRRQADVAKASGVPVRTLRRHLEQLVASGLVTSKGRQGRRTNTYGLSGVEADIMADGFLPLPRFMLGQPWTSCVVYSWILYRAELSPGGDVVEDSLPRIAKSVGITRQSVYNALETLSKAGLVDRERMLDGDVARITLLSPPANLGCKKMAEYPVKKWPMGRQKMAGLLSKKGPTELVQRNRVDQIEVLAEKIEQLAGRIFDKAGYDGDQGGNFWKMAALLHIGVITEHEVWDACAGAVECQAKSRPAYVFAIVKGHLAKRGADLQTEMAKVRIVPDWPTSPPYQATRHDVA